VFHILYLQMPRQTVKRTKHPIPRNVKSSQEGQIFKFRKFTSFTNVSSTAGSSTFFGTSFHLDELSEYTSMTDLFDQYRFDSVELFITSLNQAPLATTTATSCPALEIAVDFDDAVAPASLNAMRNYANLIVVPLGRSKKIKFTPHSTTYEYDGTTSVPSGNRRLAWHDCAQPTIRHYGLKWALASQPQISTFQFAYAYTFSFKNVR
jgi:hypothetical protein